MAVTCTYGTDEPKSDNDGHQLEKMQIHTLNQEEEKSWFYFARQLAILLLYKNVE